VGTQAISRVAGGTIWTIDLKDVCENTNHKISNKHSERKSTL
jgi:hypothetical protein